MRAFIGSMLVAGCALVAGAAGPALVGSPNDATVVAWFRGGDQEFNGTLYHFLGASDMQVTFEVKPLVGAALELLWGSKNDKRVAVVVVNGQSLPVTGGGDYNGFRWLRVPLPDGLKGERYGITLKPGEGGKAAFIADVRLTAPGGDAKRPDLKQPSYKAKSEPKAQAARKRSPWMGFQGEGFPEMRKVWDTPTAAPAQPASDAHIEAAFRLAEKHARQANEAFFRSRRFIDGWLAYADPATGLIPRNLNESRDFWNGRDSAADNWPFMVLTAAMTDRPLFEGRMLEMLRTETKLTCRVDRLPDDYSFSKKGWRREKLDLDAIIFDGAEYVKDGLLPITEWLGKSPWSERAIGIIDDIWKNAQIETPFGKIPTLNFEVNGDLLQACARLFWFTGGRKYLDWAIRLGDYYLLGGHHPTRDMKDLALGDHSCEVINGLSELYVACAHVAPEKREAYRKPLHEMYDRILEIGSNEHGLLYLRVNTRTGEHSAALTDNWGYNYDGIYTAFLLDKITAYRDAVRKALSNLKEHYTGQGGMCQSNTADGYADSIEGAITLLNREPVASAMEWVDAEIKTMWGRQHPNGIIEGWHGDGNSARTSLMYALWKTQGITVQPWRADVRFGAAREGGSLCISVVADKPWEGRLIFDKQRHKLNMHLPLDYPRINMFPEWFTAQAGARYEVNNLATGEKRTRTGKELLGGIAVPLKAGEEVRLIVKTAANAKH
ncbi:MAG: hypothetical protein NT105_00310 [Verrucomicrobia bacterium]|nr:hypothetical protein [Verrucomicrobiota bacterium]